jgi:dehydrogenase/reductase SDR family protein 4
MSKVALIGLGKALASELGVEGIRVNTICPGVVRTKLSEMLWKNDVADHSKDKLFLRRFSDPWEMGGTIAYLLSEDSGFVTGETVIAAGGIQARL